MTEPAPETNPDPGDELPQNLEAAKKLRAEAASLRKRNRELEADNERLITQAGARQRADIEAVASQVLIDGTDVWRLPEDVQQGWFDTQFGEISSDSVITAAKQLAASKPHLAKPVVTPPPSQQPLESLRPGASPQPAKEAATSWHSALRGSGI